MNQRQLDTFVLQMSAEQDQLRASLRDKLAQLPTDEKMALMAAIAETLDSDSLHSSIMSHGALIGLADVMLNDITVRMART